MISRYGIPIRNIYCMLCYYCEFDPTDYTDSFGEEGFEDIYSLMARLLDDSLRPVIRRGLYREYTDVNEQLSIPQGKVDFDNTLREYSRNRRIVHCEHDVFTVDNRFNRIVRWALEYLVGYPGLDSKVADNLEQDLGRMYGVSKVRPTKSMFDSVRISRNNRYYVLVLNICRLLFEMKVINETGDGRYPDFSIDDMLAKIYERFIFNYCDMKFDGLDVSREQLRWDLADGYDQGDLPTMNTDISICDPKRGRKLIVDAKFYKNMMSSFRDGADTLNSNNLYQIFSYINNDTFEGEVCGLLIYPQVRAEGYRKRYKFRNGHDISVMTVNLDAEWSEIEDTLQSLSSW